MMKRTALVLFAVTLVLPATAQQRAPETVEYKGRVTAALEGEVAFGGDGLLTKINFTAGQPVKKGDLLFEFASRGREVGLALAQANLKQAEAELRLADVKVGNARTLRSRNVGSELQLQEAEAQKQVATAKAEQASANVQLAEMTLSQARLYAPLSGVISRSQVREGAFISTQAQDRNRLATIVQLDPIHVVGKAPVGTLFERGATLKSLEQVAERREFGLILPTGDSYAHKGRVVGVAYYIDPATQTSDVTIEFPNPDYLLRPGLEVTLQSSVRAQ
jgi:RND family efflux transporter MFP subunit